MEFMRKLYLTLVRIINVSNGILFRRAFAELQRAAINFVMSLRPSAWNNLSPTGRILIKFDI